MMFCVVLGAEPTHFQRLVVVVMVGLDFQIAADFAGLLRQPPIPDGITNSDVRGALFGMSAFPDFPTNIEASLAGLRLPVSPPCSNAVWIVQPCGIVCALAFDALRRETILARGALVKGR
jgi:hypothetical protein